MVRKALLLRALNVGGRSKLKMAALREVAVACGWRAPHTILQSGNLVGESPAVCDERLTEQFAQALREAHQLSTDLVLLDAKTLQQVIADMPFFIDESCNPSHILLHFLIGQPDLAGWQEFADSYPGPERMYLGDGVLYLHYVNGIGRSKLTTAKLTKALGTAGTARNWKTVHAIYEALMAEV